MTSSSVVVKLQLDGENLANTVRKLERRVTALEQGNSDAIADTPTTVWKPLEDLELNDNSPIYMHAFNKVGILEYVNMYYCGDLSNLDYATIHYDYSDLQSFSDYKYREGIWYRDDLQRFLYNITVGRSVVTKKVINLAGLLYVILSLPEGRVAEIHRIMSK